MNRNVYGGVFIFQKLSFLTLNLLPPPKPARIEKKHFQIVQLSLRSHALICNKYREVLNFYDKKSFL